MGHIECGWADRVRVWRGSSLVHRNTVHGVLKSHQTGLVGLEGDDVILLHHVEGSGKDTRSKGAHTHRHRQGQGSSVHERLALTDDVAILISKLNGKRCGSSSDNRSRTSDGRGSHVDIGRVHLQLQASGNHGGALEEDVSNIVSGYGQEHSLAQHTRRQQGEVLHSRRSNGSGQTNVAGKSNSVSKSDDISIGILGVHQNVNSLTRNRLVDSSGSRVRNHSLIGINDSRSHGDGVSRDCSHLSSQGIGTVKHNNAEGFRGSGHSVTGEHNGFIRHNSARGGLNLSRAVPVLKLEACTGFKIHSVVELIRWRDADFHSSSCSEVGDSSAINNSVGRVDWRSSDGQWVWVAISNGLNTTRNLQVVSTRCGHRHAHRVLVSSPGDGICRSDGHLSQALAISSGDNEEVNKLVRRHGIAIGIRKKNVEVNISGKDRGWHAGCSDRCGRGVTRNHSGTDIAGKRGVGRHSGRRGRLIRVNKAEVVVARRCDGVSGLDSFLDNGNFQHNWNGCRGVAHLDKGSSHVVDKVSGGGGIGNQVAKLIRELHEEGGKNASLGRAETLAINDGGSHISFTSHDLHLGRGNHGVSEEELHSVDSSGLERDLSKASTGSAFHLNNEGLKGLNNVDLHGVHLVEIVRLRVRELINHTDRNVNVTSNSRCRNNRSHILSKRLG